MNTGETVSEASRGQASARVGQATPNSEAAKASLGKALDALFKAQEHLNTGADQGGDEISKVIDSINQTLRGLQREVSQVIYRIGKGT
jgi:hypothetical protein